MGLWLWLSGIVGYAIIGFIFSEAVSESERMGEMSNAERVILFGILWPVGVSFYLFLGLIISLIIGLRKVYVFLNSIGKKLSGKKISR